MNIHSNLNPIAPNLPDSPSSRIGAVGNAAAPAAAPSGSFDPDQTHLSQAAVAASATSSLSDVRLDKVASIQQALASGSYSVSPSDLAGKLIDHLLR